MHNYFNLKLSNISILFLVAFSSYYLSSPLSPVYISFSLGILFFSVSKKTMPSNYLSIYLLLISIFYLVQQFLISPTRLTDGIVFFVSIVSLPLLYSLSKNKSFKYYYKLFTLFKVTSVFIFSIDACIRFMFPNYHHFDNFQGKDIGNMIFYVYKTNSIMFLDSNFVALTLLPILCSSLIINRIHERKIWGTWDVLLFILLILTLSRAAIFSFIIGYAIIFRKGYLNKLIITFGGILILILLLENDGSGQSKLYLYSIFFDYLLKAPMLSLFLGVGFGSAQSYLGMGAHSSIITLCMETGIIGLLLYIICQLLFCIKSRSSVFLIFSYQLASISLSTVAQTTFFVSLFFVCIMDEKRHERLSLNP